MVWCVKSFPASRVCFAKSCKCFSKRVNCLKTTSTNKSHCITHGRTFEAKEETLSNVVCKTAQRLWVHSRIAFIVLVSCNEDWGADQTLEGECMDKKRKK